VAVSDELQITATPLPFIERHSWKDLLRRVASIIEAYDARGLVIGLPLGLDGSDGEAAQEARRLAENFRRSLNVPVYLQDERLTTLAAKEKMRSEGVRTAEIESRVDSESAALILRDFMDLMRS
jgi:putative Holliday junction resolvase